MCTHTYFLCPSTVPQSFLRARLDPGPSLNLTSTLPPSGRQLFWGFLLPDPSHRPSVLPQASSEEAIPRRETKTCSSLCGPQPSQYLGAFALWPQFLPLPGSPAFGWLTFLSLLSQVVFLYRLFFLVLVLPVGWSILSHSKFPFVKWYNNKVFFFFLNLKKFSYPRFLPYLRSRAWNKARVESCAGPPTGLRTAGRAVPEGRTREGSVPRLGAQHPACRVSWTSVRPVGCCESL